MRAGQKLKLFREYRNQSREAMAELLGVSPRTYQDIENDHRQLNLEELQLVATHLDVPVDAFLSEDINFVNITNGEQSPGIMGTTGNNNTNNVVTLDKEFMNEVLALLRVLVDRLGRE